MWWPEGAWWALTTCWMGPPGGSTPVLRVASLRVRPSSPTKTTPRRVTRGWRELSERTGAHHPGFDVYCPTLSVVEGFPPVVGWLEREPYFTTTYAVCEAFVDALAASMVVWAGDVLPVWSWSFVMEDPGLKFLAAAATATDRTYVMTLEDEALLLEGRAGAQDLEAWQVDRWGRVRLSFASPPPVATDEGRASDPTVACSADGNLRVVVWEERVSGDVARLRWVFDHWDGPVRGWVRSGPFDVDVAVAGTKTAPGSGAGPIVTPTEMAVAGGDPCVTMTRSFIYLSWQGLEGGIRVARLPAALTPYALGGPAPVWQLPDRGDEDLGPGFFVNHSVETVDGADLGAAVWEYTEGGPGAADKVVGQAYFRSAGDVFTVVRRATIPMPEPEDGVTWVAKAPTVAVSPQGVVDLYGVVTAEIVFFLARVEELPIGTGVVIEAALLHIAFEFGTGNVVPLGAR